MKMASGWKLVPIVILNKFTSTEENSKDACSRGTIVPIEEMYRAKNNYSCDRMGVRNCRLFIQP